MSSIREQIVSRIEAALNNVTDAGANVFRSREEPVTLDITPAIVVMPDTEDDTIFSAYADKHELLIDIAICVRGDPYDSIADPIAVSAHKIISTDAALANLVTHLRKISSKWEAEEADHTAGALIMKYRITYLTNASDISSSNFS